MSTIAHAHHVFPKTAEFLSEFERLGINVHDPRFGAWWNGKAHVAASAEYNRAWREFLFGGGGKRTAGEAFEFAQEQASRYGFQVNF